jgi:hypothetical protein
MSLKEAGVLDHNPLPATAGSAVVNRTANREMDRMAAT